MPAVTLDCLFGGKRCAIHGNLYATALHRRRNTVCSALLSNGPQQTLRCFRVRPYLERRFWTRPGRTSAWWDNFVHEVIPEEWLEIFRMSRRSLLNLSELLRPHIEGESTRMRSPVLILAVTWFPVDVSHSLCRLVIDRQQQFNLVICPWKVIRLAFFFCLLSWLLGFLLFLGGFGHL